MNTLKNYVEAMFHDFPQTRENFEVRINILSSMEDKYSDLISMGKTEQEALGTVISQFGDINELKEAYGIAVNDDEIQYLSTDRLNEYLTFSKKYAHAIAIGVSMIILGMLAPVLTNGGIVGVVLFLSVIAISVAIFILSGFRANNYEDITMASYHLFENDSIMVQNEENKFRPKFQLAITTGVILCILSVIFLILNGTDAIVIVVGTPLDSTSVLNFIPLFGLVTIAVYLFVTFGIRNGVYKLLLRDEETIEELKYGEKYGWLYRITMPLSGLVFLLLSWNRWEDLGNYPTWLIFPIVSLVTHGLIEVLSRTNKRDVDVKGREQNE